MDRRQNTNLFLSSLDEDLLMYEEQLTKRGFTSLFTLKYLREKDLEEIGMAEGHKHLLMNAISKLQSPGQPRGRQTSIEKCKTSNVTYGYGRKRRLPFETVLEKLSANDNDRDDSYEDNFDRVGQQSSSEDEEQNNVTILPLEKSFETPVQRFLRHKSNDIVQLQGNLKEKKTKLKKLQSNLYAAQNENSKEQSKPACGQCHLRLGHTRRNCTLSPCKSVYSCGLIDKHPDEKKFIKTLENETTQIQRKIQKLQGEHDSYVRAKTSADRSKSKVIEDKLLSESPSRYINANGSKNWMLLNKDVAALEKKMNVKEFGLPDRKSMMAMLKDSSKEYELSSKSRRVNENPKRPFLESHGIKFPTRSSSTSTISTNPSTSTHSAVDGEFDDFAMAVSLQNEEIDEYKEDVKQHEAASSLIDMFNCSATRANKS